MAVSNLRIGTSGWNYPTGRGRWDGIFYPPRRGRGSFDELSYYADRFDTVEINSTFYGQPRPGIAKAWPPGFKDSPASREYLDALLGRFSDYPVAVEVRHRSWSDHIADTVALLNAHGAAWAQIDEPKFRFSIRQNQLPNVTSFYYMRLHGRNAGAWWKHEKSEDRYDYLYSADETITSRPRASSMP